MGEEGWPLTRAELAQRYGVARSAVTRALDAAERRHRADPARCPAPPRPVNPDGPGWPRYWPAEFDAWWRTRPAPGRPRRQ